jgi:hypothetical protein
LEKKHSLAEVEALVAIPLTRHEPKSEVKMRPSVVKALREFFSEEYLSYMTEISVSKILNSNPQVDPSLQSRRDSGTGVFLAEATAEEFRLAAEQSIVDWEQMNNLLPLTPFEELSAKDKKPWFILAQRLASHTVKNPGKAFAENLYIEYDGRLPSPEFRGEEPPPYPCLEWYPAGSLPAHRQRLIGFRWNTFPVPVQTVVNRFEGPSERPLEGRFWKCGFVAELSGQLRVVSYPAARRERYLETRQFVRDVKEFSPAYLVEVFENYLEKCGESGTAYELEGHAVMTQFQLRDYLQKIIQPSDRVPLYQEILDIRELIQTGQ